MQKDRFDEFQVAKRHRIGYQTLFLTIALIVANGIIKMNFIWADPYDGNACVDSYSANVFYCNVDLERRVYE